MLHRTGLKMFSQDALRLLHSINDQVAIGHKTGASSAKNVPILQWLFGFFVPLAASRPAKRG
jgi:hypothetical protein